MKELLTEAQLAELWNTTPRHLRHLRVQESLPHIKLGSLIRYDLAAATEWAQSRAVNAPGRRRAGNRPAATRRGSSA